MEPSATEARAETSLPAAPPVSAAAHLQRLVALLAVGLVGAVLVRSLLVPETFGRDGHYRAAAIDEIVAKEPVYLGSTTCVECHKEKVAEHAKGKHKGINCETCHGPATGHLTQAKTRVHMEVVKTEDLCLTCHRKIVGKPAGFPAIDLEEHRKKREFDKDTKCLDCHASHKPEG